MNSQEYKSIDFRLAYYSGDRKTGGVVIVSNTAGQLSIRKLDTLPADSKPNDEKPIFIGITDQQQTVVLDPVGKHIQFLNAFPEDAFPAHIYQEPNGQRAWFMNDGDKETGNDRINCGENGSSVSVIENINSANAKYIKTICVGRGHHQANFCYPTTRHPNVPAYALISNLKDGTISIIDNDPQSLRYLTLVNTIDLCEPDKEANAAASIPNNAFPHGLAYSTYSGKIYNLNNGYGTVAVIDPLSLQIESRFNFKGFSNLFISPNGRYIFGRGADRKSDSQHVIAKLSVLDLDSNKIIKTFELRDIYFSKYFFNPEGDRLYLTTSSSGSDAQKANIKSDVLLVLDISNLPTVNIIHESRLGTSSGTLDFAVEDNQTRLVFSSNSEEGMLTILDKNGKLIEKIKVDEPGNHSRLWCY